MFKEEYSLQFDKEEVHWIKTEFPFWKKLMTAN